MSMNLEKLQVPTAAGIAMGAGVLCNCLTIIFLNNRDFFLTVDILKLAIIGIAIAFPICLLNLVVHAFLVPDDSPHVRHSLIPSLSFSLASVTIPLIIKLFFNLSYLGVFISFIVFELCLILLLFAIFKKNSSK